MVVSDGTLFSHMVFRTESTCFPITFKLEKSAWWLKNNYAPSCSKSLFFDYGFPDGVGQNLKRLMERTHSWLGLHRRQPHSLASGPHLEKEKTKECMESS